MKKKIKQLPHKQIKDVFNFFNHTTYTNVAKISPHIVIIEATFYPENSFVLSVKTKTSLGKTIF